MMGTWAAVTRLDAPEVAPLVQKLGSSNISVAVVDTNAIISGLQLHRIADTAVTIPEVLSEVRDKHTRQALANVPFALECQQPTEESVKAVLRFARATGDLHSLSTADIRLIALAHTLQLARHGDNALRALPDLPSVRKGNAPAAKELPGWNETGDKWADLDKLTEDDLAEQELAGLLSKVSQAVQSLDISNSQHAAKQPSEQLSTSPSSVLETASTSGEPSTASGAAPLHRTNPQSAQNQESQLPAQHDTGDDWQRASSSHNAARKKKRKQQRRAATHSVDAPEMQMNPKSSLPSAPAPPRSSPSTQADEVVYSSSSGNVVVSNAEDQTAATLAPKNASEMAVTIGTSQPTAEALLDESAPDSAEAQASESAEAETVTNSPQSDHDHHDYAESQQTDSAISGSVTGSNSESEQDSTDDEDFEEEAALQSSVASVTADFAMQNVILQMGLRLVAPDGMRIKKLSRWVLRCSACFKITKEPGRLFCPHCGNATLDKVEAVIGPDGTEQYGVRKRFNTRGTRYSLPKPKGGSQRNAPILREDVLMQKLNKRRNRKPKDEGVDAFAPEYGPDSWFQKNHGSAAQYKGAAAALASWKHNPNERQHRRTNRRG